MMDLSEIASVTFPKSVRGFNVVLVKEFLSSIAKEIESVKEQMASLENRNEHLELQLAEYKKLEKNITFSLAEAKQLKLEAELEAKRQAEVIYQEAIKKSNEEYSRRQAELQKLINEITQLRSYRDEVAKKISSFLNKLDSQLEEIYEINIDLPPYIDKEELKMSVMRSEETGLKEKVHVFSTKKLNEANFIVQQEDMDIKNKNEGSDEIIRDIIPDATEMWGEKDVSGTKKKGRGAFSMVDMDEYMKKARKVESQGVNVSYLNIGDPPKFGFKPPEQILEAYCKALCTQISDYSPSAGILSARLAIAEKMISKGVKVEAENIFVTDGASEAADIVFSASLNEGDEILAPLPVYPLYIALANKVAAKQVFYNLNSDKNWKVDPADVESKITKRTKILLVINPNNPTGSVIEVNVLRQLLDIAKRHKLIVVSDEVYSEMVFEGKHTPIASLVDDDVPVFTLESMSKNFLVPGWRMGWVGITNNYLVSDIRNAMLKLADARLCANTPAQYTIETALSLPQDYFQPALLRLKNQRDITFRYLNNISGMSSNKPQGAFYAFPRMDIRRLGFESDENFVLDVLKNLGILLVHGSGFGMDRTQGFFRIAFLPSADELQDIYYRLKTYLEAKIK
ncbi:hypothetical protein CHS0354_024052 [Potamilus streckersoni]|uniref:Aminotransferase class I/classII large domain-containing protein n=1 Tax=Potamilus streckersoni TaxID=2493646 RepID=A0AAE0RZK5_9BIVA|nr:hypothetical protein CHS0354_024052 [Potamilus streckersoni]